MSAKLIKFGYGRGNRSNGLHHYKKTMTKNRPRILVKPTHCNDFYIIEFSVITVPCKLDFHINPIEPDLITYDIATFQL